MYCTCYILRLCHSFVASTCVWAGIWKSIWWKFSAPVCRIRIMALCSAAHLLLGLSPIALPMSWWVWWDCHLLDLVCCRSLQFTSFLIHFFIYFPFLLHFLWWWSFLAGFPINHLIFLAILYTNTNTSLPIIHLFIEFRKYFIYCECGIMENVGSLWRGWAWLNNFIPFLICYWLPFILIHTKHCTSQIAFNQLILVNWHRLHI